MELEELELVVSLELEVVSLLVEVDSDVELLELEDELEDEVVVSATPGNVPATAYPGSPAAASLQ